MTLQQMEYIVAVYRVRHFAKAAEMCGVTQPTLSAMIQKLEKELGVKIFERSSQQVTPTAIGKLVVEQAWKVISRANKIKDIIAEEEQSLSGTFRIGILPTIAPYLLHKTGKGEPRHRLPHTRDEDLRHHEGAQPRGD